MHQYGVRDVERLLQISRSTIRGLVAAGFVMPQRGPRGAWRFSFRDLIVLRTAQALAQAKLPAKRITRSLRELRRRLPEAMPLSGLSIAAEGNRVVVREGAQRWQADSGQYLLAFGGDPSRGSLKIMEQPQSASAADLDDYIERGAALHEQRQLDAAEAAYRDGISACGEDAILLFNLALVLEDAGKPQEALSAYQSALRADPRFADCHYNVALLCEALGDKKRAIRHMAQYRRLRSGR